MISLDPMPQKAPPFVPTDAVRKQIVAAIDAKLDEHRTLTKRKNDKVRAIKITYYDASMVTYVNPAQVIYWQVYTGPQARRLPKMDKPQQAWGEIIAPGGAFFFWNQDEAKEAWKVLGVD